jgi:hypothetical protein
VGDSTLDRLTSVLEPGDAGVLWRRRWLHRIVMGLIGLILLAAVLDGLDVLDSVGPDEGRITATGSGYELTVEHPTFTRPALATVFRFAIRREGGFDEPVQVGVSRDYLEAWDLNGVLPGPAAETADGPWIIWEFDPPPGDELVVTYEARIEPGVETNRDGTVAVFEEDEPVLEVGFTTAVRP